MWADPTAHNVAGAIILRLLFLSGGGWLLFKAVRGCWRAWVAEADFRSLREAQRRRPATSDELQQRLADVMGADVMTVAGFPPSGTVQNPVDPSPQPKYVQRFGSKFPR